MLRKIVKVFLLLIIVLSALSGWFWWRNSYSREVLKLEILGPSDIQAGDEITYTVRYKNNGSVRLENPKLIFNYPETSVMSDEWREVQDEKIIVRGEGNTETSLDDIQPGEERTERFKGIIIGEKDSVVTAKARINYRPRNLNVNYESETSYNLVISEVPITFEISLPSRVEPGKNFSFEMNYFSRIDYPLTDLTVLVEYPSGFEFSESRPKSSFEENEWELGVINKGEGGRIEVFGELEGDPSSAKIFKAKLGFWREGNFILLKESVKGIEMATPLILITHQVNGNPNYTVEEGEYLYYEIFFKNTGDSPLEGLFLTARLDGSFIDLDSVQPGSGSFQENSAMIIWDSNSNSKLRFLSVMEEGKVDFWVKLKDEIDDINPELIAEVSLSNIKEKIKNKINSRLVVEQKGYYSVGPFDNYGPQSPVVGSSTSYTIHWKVENKNNNISNTKIKATLPSEVRLSGEVSPKESSLSFDPVTREVVWDVGGIEPGEDSLEVFFQIIFNPTVNQRGRVAKIINEAIISGLDSWTDQVIYNDYRSIETDLPDDESISEITGVVR
jgi:hypothetical protein